MKFVNRLISSAAIGTMIFVGGAANATEVIRMGHHHAVGGLIDNTAKKFAELVTEKTNGEVEVRIFPGAQLGQERELFDLLNNNGVDATITSLGHMDRYYPPIAATSFPFAFRSWDHARNALTGDFGKMLKSGLKEKSNAQIVGWLEVGFRDLLFRGDPVTELAGMKGLEMRSPENFVWIRMYELMGAKPTPITWGEIYVSMQTGVLRGLDTPAFAAVDMKFNEVTNAMVKTNHMFAVMGIVVNKNRMAKLSPAHQKAVEEAGFEAGMWINNTVLRPGADTAYGKLEELGVKVVAPSNPDEWARAMRPLWEELKEKNPGSDKALQMLLATE